ncbi:MAG: DUF3634 family protein [Crocinitomicaceae bacterium]|nr:DUF3634 family protein [Crocinitomicaceae bacterium]
MSTLKIALLKLNPKTDFIFQVKDEEVVRVKGEQHSKFLNDCKDVAKENGLKKGLIYGLKGANGKIKVQTSSGIPSSVAQRIRNVWSFYT